MEQKQILYLIGIIVGIASILVVILVPMSFSGVEYDEYAFKRRKTTGNVDEEVVYASGNHLIGPDYEFRKFTAVAHFERFIGVTVFTSDRLQVTITANIQYFIRPDQLKYLFREYDIRYKDILYSNANDALKAAATLYSTREFILERSKVENAMFKSVKERLGGRCCELNCEVDDSCVEGCLEYYKCTPEDWGLYVDVRYFQLHEVRIPDELNDRYLASIILYEETETEKLKQEATVIRKETDGLVKGIENEASEISQDATATSSLILSKARANSEATVQQSRTDGLKHLYDQVGMSNNEQKMSFNYLRTLRGKDSAKLTVDYDQLIAGPMTNP